MGKGKGETGSGYDDDDGLIVREKGGRETILLYHQ